MVFWRVKTLHHRNTGIVVLLEIDQKFDFLIRSSFRWKQEPCFEWSSTEREGMQKQESISSSEKHIVKLGRTFTKQVLAFLIIIHFFFWKKSAIVKHVRS